MPTPRQVRFHYGKITKLVRKLSWALTDAHNHDVIKYEKFAEESPCKCLWDMEQRIEATTEKALASAMREEIRSGK